MKVRSLCDERGDDTVAAALVYTALLLLAWAVLQVAVVLLGRGMALEAARDGVSAARLSPANTATSAAAARDYVTRVTDPWLSNVEAHSFIDGHNVVVTVTADVVSLMPFARFTVSQTAYGPIEKVEP